jgi:hypothetical protein
MRRIEKPELLSAIAAWSFTSGTAADLRATMPRALGWLRARWEAGEDHLPLDLVHDLGHLLLAGRDFRFSSDTSLDAWSEDERRFRLEYEDGVLGRWALDPTVAQAHVVIAGLGSELADLAVAHALGLALGDRGERVDVVRGNAALLRTEAARIAELCGRLPEEHAEWAEIVDPAWIAWSLEHRRRVLANLSKARLFTDEDLWEVTHLEHLPNESTRIALREIHRSSRSIGPASTATAMRVKRKRQEVPIDRSAADLYPAGGFEAIATKGRFENLVRTEIAYVGEGAAGVDLFDVRFAQNELLYYTRDESPMLDAKTELSVVIDRAGELRVKQAALPAQTLVMVEGLALRLFDDLVSILGPSGSVLNVEWIESAEDLRAITEERRLFELTLADDLAHGRARLGFSRSIDGAHARGRIVFSPLANRGFEAKAWVSVGEAEWILDGDRFDVSVPAGLRDLADALLARVF